MATNDVQAEVEDAEIDVEFLCPFCRKQAGITQETSKGRACLHSIPMCEAFRIMAPERYIEKALRAMQIEN